MTKIDYNRYSIIRNGSNEVDTLPFIKLPVNPSDKYEFWNAEFSRMDKLSEKYYGNPFYDFLILYANPEYLSEFDIPDSAVIRIAFPLGKAKADYEAILSAYRTQ